MLKVGGEELKVMLQNWSIRMAMLVGLVPVDSDAVRLLLGINEDVQLVNVKGQDPLCDS